MHRVGVEQALQRLLRGERSVEPCQGVAFERATESVPAVVFQQARAQRPVSIGLQPAIDGGHHPVPRRSGSVAEAGDHFGPHHLGDIGCVEFNCRPVEPRLHRELQGSRVFGFVDKRELEHAPQDIGTAVPRTLRVRNGVEHGRRLRNAGQEGRLGQGQLVQALAEIHFRGCRYPVCPLAEENLVQVKGKDLLLGKRLLDLQGEQEFPGLADKGALGCQEIGSRQLLGNGAAALGSLPGKQEVRTGAHQPLVVKTGVLKEAVVFSGKHGMNQDVGDVVIPNRGPAKLAQLRNETPVTGIDPERHLQGHVADGFDRWEPRGQEIPRPGTRGACRDKEGQRDADQPQKSLD